MDKQKANNEEKLRFKKQHSFVGSVPLMLRALMLRMQAWEVVAR